MRRKRSCHTPAAPLQTGDPNPLHERDWPYADCGPQWNFTLRLNFFFVRSTFAGTFSFRFARLHALSTPVNPEELEGYRVFNAWGILVPTDEVLAAENIGNFRVILRFDRFDEALVNLAWEQASHRPSFTRWVFLLAARAHASIILRKLFRS